MITLTPETAINVEGEDHTVTATVTDDSQPPEPQEGVEVTFTVISGPNQGDSGKDTTLGNGQATYEYKGSGGVGIDKIQACFTSGETQVCSNVVDKEWTQEIITIAPMRAQNPVDTDHTVTATITNLKGTPIDNVDVDFDVKDGPNQGDSGTGTTDENGQAAFTYTGDGGVGTDYIRACFTNAAEEEVCTDYGADTYDNDAVKEWGDPCPAIKPNPATLPAAVLNEPYSETITGFGGNDPYTFAITSGFLPQVLSLNPATGVLSGTPTESGTFTFEITVTDSDECPGSRTYTFEVCPGPVTLLPETSTLPGGTIGVPYSRIIKASGENGQSGFVYDVTGTLPPGLSWRLGSVEIYGTPTTAGSWTFTVTAHYSGQEPCSGSRDYTIRIGELTPVPTLSEWGMILTALSLCLTGYVFLRRRSN